MPEPIRLMAQLMMLAQDIRTIQVECSGGQHQEKADRSWNAFCETYDELYRLVWKMVDAAKGD